MARKGLREKVTSEEKAKDSKTMRHRIIWDISGPDRGSEGKGPGVHHED